MVHIMRLCYYHLFKITSTHYNKDQANRPLLLWVWCATGVSSIPHATALAAVTHRGQLRRVGTAKLCFNMFHFRKGNVLLISRALCVCRGRRGETSVTTAQHDKTFAQHVLMLYCLYTWNIAMFQVQSCW